MQRREELQLSIQRSLASAIAAMQGGSSDNTANHGNTPIPDDNGEPHSNLRYPQAATTADSAAAATLTQNPSLVSLLPFDSGNPGSWGYGGVNNPTLDGKVDLINQVCDSEDENVLDDVTKAEVGELHRMLAATWSDDDESNEFDFAGTSDLGSVGMNTLNGYGRIYHPSSPSPQPLSPQGYGEHALARHPSPLMLNFPRLDLGNVGEPYGAVEAFLPGNEYAEGDAAASRTPGNGALVGPWDHILSPTTPEDL